MTTSTVALKSMADHPMVRLLKIGHFRYYSHHLERLREGLDENIEWYTPGNHPLSGKIVGIDAVLEWCRKSDEVTDGTFRADTHNILADEDTAVVVATWRGERKGLVLEMPGVQVFKFNPENLKVTESRIWVYDDEFVNKFWSA